MEKAQSIKVTMNGYQLSGIQKQFWTLSKLFPETGAYNMSCFVRLDGPVDKIRLKKAWQQLFFSSDIFRTGFCETNGIPVAYLKANIEPPWEELSCPEEDVNKLAALFFYKPFNLSEDDLVRVALIEVSKNRSYFIFVQHHIITDLHSKEKIAEFISQLYNRKKDNWFFEPYSAFPQKEKVFLESPRGKCSLLFWRKKMESYPGPLELPCITEHQPVFRSRGSSVDWELPLHLAETVNDHKKKNIGQPFLYFLTAYIAFLSRISGQTHFSVGVPLTNRRYDDAHNTIGAFVNILPVVVEISKEDSFSSLYDKVRKEMLLNHRHQEVPFFKAAEFYKGMRNDSRPHLLQAGFTSEPLFELKLKGIESTGIPVEQKGAQMDLFFAFWPTRNGYSGAWQFNSDLVNAELVRDWQGCFHALLENALKYPATPVRSLRILSSAAESRHANWNNTQRDYPLRENLSIHLRNAFSTHKEKLALIYGDTYLSYEQMDAIVCQTACMLHQEFGEKKRIALMLNSSPEMVFAIHGIIQSGNAYVPIGTDWPKERIHMVLNDIAPAAIIAEKQYISMLSGSGVPIIDAKTLAEPANLAGSYPELNIGPKDTAYIIYTSGSTGKPKGAEQPHDGLMNRILWMQDEYSLEPNDRVLQKTPYTFDVSVWEFLWPFFAGATLVTIEPDGHKDPRYIKTMIRDYSISVLHFVPSMLSVFLNQNGLSALTSLRNVICSGEALTNGQAQQFFNTFGKARLHNLYGPTEASIDVTHWECTRNMEKAPPQVPIGRPIANTQLYILDQCYNLCPPYTTGELFIGGVGLAKGYWMRSDLTREKFIQNPFGPGRLYKTGDLCRYRLDGVIEYIGRTDFQVKLRGLRVELGEIEKSLEGHPGVEKAVVTLWRKSEGDDRLIAYFTCPNRAFPPGDEAIKSHLREHLPEYMIPSHFMALAQMPHNSNGKLDRKLLPLPSTGPETKKTLPPENDLQQMIHKIWTEVLSDDNFGIDDAFFDLGGSSLLSIQVVLKLEQMLNVKIPVVKFYQYPTIRQFSDFLKQDGNKKPNAIKNMNKAGRRYQYLSKKTTRPVLNIIK